MTWAHGKRRTLGSVEHLTLDQARDQARQAVAEYVQSGLPALAKSRPTSCTLEVLLNDHFEPWAVAERNFGAGSATAENMSKAASDMSSMAAALRDTSAGAIPANGMTGAQITATYAGAGDTLAGVPTTGPKMVIVNTTHASFSDSSKLAWGRATKPDMPCWAIRTSSSMETRHTSLEPLSSKISSRRCPVSSALSIRTTSWIRLDEKVILVAALLCMLIPACATQLRRADSKDFSVSVTDRATEKRYDVVLDSAADGPLCLSKESWPIENGTFPMGYQGAVLTTTNGPLHPKAAMTAYCPGGCGEVRLEPGQTLRASIAYAAFGDAEVIAADAARSLSFPVYHYCCER